MKVIFLDIDGVLNSASFMKARQKDFDTVDKSEEDRWLDMLDQEAVNLLNKAVKATSANIVVSSTWRILHSAEKLSFFLKEKGFIGSIIDITPSFSGKPRGDEIQAWLDKNQIDDFVIIDDDNDMGELSHRLVQTSWQTGIQQQHVDKIISMLSQL